MSVFAQALITAYPYQLKAGGMLDQRSADTRCQTSVSGRNGKDRNNINPSQTRVLTLHRQFGWQAVNRSPSTRATGAAMQSAGRGALVRALHTRM